MPSLIDPFVQIEEDQTCLSPYKNGEILRVKYLTNIVEQSRTLSGCSTNTQFPGATGAPLGSGSQWSHSDVTGPVSRLSASSGSKRVQAPIPPLRQRQRSSVVDLWTCPPAAAPDLEDQDIMGAFLDKPKMEKHNAQGQGNGLRYGLSSMQGWRVEMEDAHTAVIGLPSGLETWSFFAVYDGHAGSQVAKYCCEHLLDHITNNQDFKGSAGAPSVENVKNGIRTGFLEIDEHMRVMSEKKHGADRSGSTAVGVLISPQHTYFINCGDSRGLLCRNRKVHFFTQDHKPSNPLEKERIQNAGGSVMIQRVNGSLAVSRALGDFDYKCVHGKGPTEQLVSPEPEVHDIERSEEDDQFIILACDGIWDVMGNEELCDFVRSRLEVTDDLEKVCNEVVDTCLYKGSRDNMSVILICFPNAPKVSPEAVKKEAELDKYLESRVEEIIKKQGEGVPDLVHVMRTLASENIPSLPPGGELASKRNVIEAVYNRLNPYKNDDTDSTSTDDMW
ncbi:Protein phosphatase 1A [Manis javanica]|nr:Protein phosphatase 1A [Manis javanica]